MKNLINLIKCKKYAFCLNKLRENNIIIRNPYEKQYISPNQEFYDELINNDKQIKSYNNKLSKIKKETIKESIYANQQIPSKWKNVIGYQKFLLKIISNDNKFLGYLGRNKRNECNYNSRNSYTNIRPRTSMLLNNIKSLKNSFDKRPSTRNRNNSFQTLKTIRKFIRSKSLNNFNSLNNNSSYAKFKNIMKKETNEYLDKFKKINISPINKINKTCIHFFKSKKQNECNKSNENNNEKNKYIINYTYKDKLMNNFQNLKFKVRLTNLRKNLYSKLASSDTNGWNKSFITLKKIDKI